MRPHTIALIEYITACRGTLQRAVAAVAPTRRDESPGTGRWSVAEVLEHLGTVERSVNVLIKRRMSKAPPAGQSPEEPVVDVPAILTRLAVLTDRSRPAEAPEPVRPAGGVGATAAWATLDETRAALLETIASTDALDLAGVSVPHALLGPLNLYEWIAFVGGHELRHAHQIADIAAPKGVQTGEPAPPFEIEALDHVALNVRDVARSVEWYGETLGLEVLHGDVWRGVPTMVGRSGYGLALFPVKGADPKPRPGPDVLAIRHVAFRVTGDHFARAQSVLTARGVPFEFQDHDISHSIYVIDPDGHEIELTTYVKD